MNKSVLLHRLVAFRKVTPVTFCHTHVKDIFPLTSKYDFSKEEKWLKAQGEGGSVSYTKDENNHHLGFITFQHKQKHNAFTGTMMHDFCNAVREAVEDKKTRCIVVRGESGNFCSGGELSFVEAIATEEGAYIMNSVMMNSLKTLASSDKVSIAVLQGSTMGGATEIASACDIRVAKRKAKVGFVQGRMGVCPGWGGGQFLVKALGKARAVEYLSTAAMVPSEELHRVGFVSHLFNDQDDLGEYLQRFSTIESNNAFVAAKRMVVNYSEKVRDPRLMEEGERRIFMSVWGHEDHKTSIENIRNSLKAAKKEKERKRE